MLISIITINYNDLDGLKKTMTSVFAQTYANIEYIVIDGGSTDGSKEFIEQHNAQLNYWLSEPDSGIYNAMNKGIKKATGDYLLFLNSGDIFINYDVLERNYHFLDGASLICFDIHVDGKNMSFLKQCPSQITFSYLVQDTLPHQSVFIHKSLFQIVGYYDESLIIVADWKFFILALGHYKASYKKVDTVLSTYNLDGISARKENWELLKAERKKVLEEEFSFYLKDFEELKNLENNLSRLRKSRKLRLLIKFGLINKF